MYMGTILAHLLFIRKNYFHLHGDTLRRNIACNVFDVKCLQRINAKIRGELQFRNKDDRDARPLENRSWEDIRGGSWPGNPAGSGQPAEDTFVDRLRQRTGLSTLDLPTEAQWEYACRAGTATALNIGKNLLDKRRCPNMSKAGRYFHNHPGGFASWGRRSSADQGTARVGEYAPNAWGLYDMHGNVWEWCLDRYAAKPEATVDPAGHRRGRLRIMRGGNYSCHAGICRSAVRGCQDPRTRHATIGFRICIAVP